MAREQIRQAIVQQIEGVRGAFSDTVVPYENALVIEYDNQLAVDTATQPDPWLAVRIRWIDAYQMELSDTPHHRFMGQIELAGVVKEGAGSAGAMRLTDYFYPLLHRRAFGPVRTHMSEVGAMIKLNGWCYYPMLIPFWSDQNG